MGLRFAGRYSPLALVLILGALLRIAGVNWGDGHPIHPDERHVINMVGGLTWNDLNPDNFAYGSLPLYLLRGLAHGISKVAGPEVESYHNYFLLGRSLSTLAAMLTVWMIYCIGRNYYDRRTGLIAATFLSLTVLHIQLSHFYTVEQMLVFFVTAAFWAALRVAREGTAFDYLLSGILTGMAIATKLSALPLGAVLVTAHFVCLMRRGRILDVRWLFLVLSFLAAYTSFYVCEPYAFQTFPIPGSEALDRISAAWTTREYWEAFGRALFSPDFLRDFWEQSNMVRGESQPIYVAVYENTKPYLYQAEQLLWWGFGPPLGILCLAGTAYLVWQCLRGMFSTLQRNARPEYFAALLPGLLILSWLLPNMLIVGGFKVKFLRYLAPLLPFWCLAGGKLMADLIGSKKTTVARLGRGVFAITMAYTLFYAAAYTTIFFKPHTHVQASDWFDKNGKPGSKLLQEHWDETLPYRQSNTPEFTPADFPSYEPDSPNKARLFAKLLSENDYIFSSSDRIYGTILSWPARWPETSRMYKLLFAGELGYDLAVRFHSPPRLFGITLNDWDADESFLNYDHPTVLVFENKRRLAAEQIERLITTPNEKFDTMTHAQALAQLPDASEALSTFGTPTSALSQVLRWWLLLTLLGWLAFPFCFQAFGSMPDRGFGASKTLGLLALSYLSWVTGMLGLTQFTWQWLVALLVILTLLSTLVLQRNGEAMAQFLQEKGRLILGWEFCFLAVGAIFLTIRAYNPEIYWGEKPMDFSFLNAFLRTEDFPPQEPWFAGRPLNYYYFGFVMVATAGKLTALDPGVLYNVACATIPAQVFVLAMSIGLTLVQRPWAGFWTAVLVVFFGNLAWPLIAYSNEVVRQGFDLFWATSRVIEGAAIEEYPLWTFLFADLHAHMMAMPACLLTLYAALSTFGAGDPRAEFRFSTVFVCSLALGSLFVTNTWDFISYSIVIGGLALGMDLAARKPTSFFQVLFDWLGGLSRASVLAIVLAGFGLMLFYPYFTVFHAGSTYHGPNRDGWVPLRDVFVLFGQFLWLHWLCLVATHFHGLSTRNRERHLILLMGSLLWAAAAIAAVALDVDAKPYVTSGFALGLCVLSAATGIFGEVRLRFSAAWFLLSLGAALMAIADLYTIADRMNTVFKAYNTIWYLLSLSAGACLYRCFLALWDILSMPQATRYGWRFLIATFLSATLSIGLLAIAATSLDVNIRGATQPERVPSVRPSIDGTLYLKTKFPSDSKGIDWLNQNVKGLATVLEAFGPSYQDFTRVCMHTGLSSVLGWEYHVQQRGQKESDIRQRQSDIATMYTSENPLEVRALLEHYKVDYVFVGELEARAHGRQVLEKFSRVPDLTLVFESEKTKIYHVQRQGGSSPASAPFLAAAPSSGNSQTSPAFLPSSAPGAAQIGAMASGPDDQLFLLNWRTGELERFERGGKHAHSMGPLLEAVQTKLQSIWVGPDGRVLGAEPTRDRIIEIGADGRKLAMLGTDQGLKEPRAAVADPTGQVWIADTGNDRVIRLGDNPRVVDQTSTGPLLAPIALAIDPQGDPLVLSLRNRAVYRIGPEPMAETLFSLPAGSSSMLDSLAGLTLDPDGAVVVSDPSNGQVYRFQADAGVEALRGAPGTPSGLAVDSAGNLYVGDALQGGVYLMAKPKSINAFRGGQGNEMGQMNQPRGVAWAQDGSFWVADFDNHRVQKFRRDGRPLLAVGQQGEHELEFNQPCDLAVLPDGGVAVADTWNHRIQILDARGKFVRSFGEFFGPRGIALGPDQLLYATDTGNGMVKVYDLEGKLVRSWGGKGKEPGKFDQPVGIAVGSDQVYVTDVMNGRVQIFSLAGEIRGEIPVASWKEHGGEPHIAVDLNNRIFVSLPAENRIALLDPSRGEIGSVNGQDAGGQPLQSPTGLDVRGQEILVSDTSQHRIQKLERAFP